MDRTTGIHHITAMASDPQRNRDFYEGVLGLRLVKRTVNFDDPGTYHLYYGDGVGSPGTILTFFPIPGIREGAEGVGVVSAVAMAVPAASLDAWRDRLAAAGAPIADTAAGVATRDPDGMAVELVEREDIATPTPWSGSVGEDMAIRGIAGATLRVREAEGTRAYMRRVLGLVDTDDGALGGQVALGGTIRVEGDLAAPRARMGAGVVHHIAFRAADGERQEAWRRALAADGANVSPIMDRDYFTSIYFREPGGVLLEIATDAPGFTRDEDIDALGTGLKLPAWIERHRQDIERVLVPLEPAAPVGGAR